MVAVPVRRVTVTAVYEDGQVEVRDTLGGVRKVPGDMRPKGSAPPAVGEVWVIQKDDGLPWRLVSQIGHRPPPEVTGSRAASDPVALSLLKALADLGLVIDKTSP